MFKIGLFYSVLLLFILGSCDQSKTSVTSEVVITKMDKTLRHVVLFKFKDTSTNEDIDRVVRSFVELPSRIKEIAAFEWGTNNSPEDLNKGFSHSFLVSFTSEEDRDKYLTHPEHLAFVEILKPHLDDVLVLDYWTK